jgi:hypothetical protein
MALPRLLHQSANCVRLDLSSIEFHGTNCPRNFTILTASPIDTVPVTLLSLRHSAARPLYVFGMLLAIELNYSRSEEYRTLI